MVEFVLGSCPVPDQRIDERITLAHGEGGRWMRRLIADCIRPTLRSAELDIQCDAATLSWPDSAHGKALAMTTDGYVVSPLFFPGGDIGQLAIFGTVNDLLVAGACPRWISLAMIVEEGLPIATLQRVLASIAWAAEQAQVAIVTGDTKVVPRGAADGLFLTTTGIGELLEPVPPGPATLEQGDCLIVSGPIGCHGVAVMCAREKLGFEPPPVSDCGSLSAAVNALRRAQISIRAMRDATRGGVAAVLHEWAAACQQTLVIEEAHLPVRDDVRSVCELLGLDPVHVANEGTMLVAVPSAQQAAALAALHAVPQYAAATCIGHVAARQSAPVCIIRGLNRKLPLDEPAGAPLPRIC